MSNDSHKPAKPTKPIPPVKPQGPGPQYTKDSWSKGVPKPQGK